MQSNQDDEGTTEKKEKEHRTPKQTNVLVNLSAEKMKGLSIYKI